MRKLLLVIYYLIALIMFIECIICIAWELMGYDNSLLHICHVITGIFLVLGFIELICNKPED